MCSNSQMNIKPLIIICGPTAVGKTSVAIDVAKHFGAEIISFDSRQFYIETCVGTAKPDEQQLNEIKHHFINSHHIWENFSAGQFAYSCAAFLNATENATKQFILVGGSGLYIDALINGMDDLPGMSVAIREQLAKLFHDEGIAGLQQQLKAKDPVYYDVVDINNRQRLMRALEVIEISGKPYSSFLGKQKHEPDSKTIYIGLNIPREQLYQRINARVDVMVQNDLKEECLQLKDYMLCNALKTVGYKEVYEHLNGKFSWDETVKLIKQHTRNYAKRQLTWFRKNENIKWFHPDDLDLIIDYIHQNIK